MTIPMTGCIEKSYAKIVEISRQMWYNGCATEAGTGFFYCLNFDNSIAIIKVCQALSISVKSLTATVASVVKQTQFDRAFFIGPNNRKHPQARQSERVFSKGN